MPLADAFMICIASCFAQCIVQCISWFSSSMACRDPKDKICPNIFHGVFGTINCIICLYALYRMYKAIK